MTKKKITKRKTKLTKQQELFCQNFVSEGEIFGNGTRSYASAYNIDLSDKGSNASARACASKLLTNINIMNRINSLLDDAGLNENHVDKRLLFWINQSADSSTSLGAIREFNKLKQRITEKIEHDIKAPITNILINPINNDK